MAKLPTPTLRGSIYYLYKRVPVRYRPVEPRRFIDMSLHTDSEADATAKAIEVWNQHVAAWEAALAGDTSSAEARFEAARELANKRGFRYLPATAVASLPYDEFMKRLQAGLSRPPSRTATLEAEAILGGAAEPPITVSRALELYWQLTKDQNLKMACCRFRGHQVKLA
ncbi:DUF6538 domain-containing protein [Paracoccus sanguinis]|uniref:DUF6538 domain-containing protein n=1 Tax=Paracoccus sanguinis TaxID=1545044 RepID=UPI0039E0FB68